MWKPYLYHDAHSWDTYVFSRPELSPFLLYSWSSIIEKSYGHRPYFLALAEKCTAEKRVSAVLPLIHFHQYPCKFKQDAWLPVKGIPPSYLPFFGFSR